MRYCADSGKIKISVKEFVTIARRRIAVSSNDDDELRGGSAPGQKPVILPNKADKQTLIYNFEDSGIKFELLCDSCEVLDGEIVIERSDAFKRGAPTAELKAQLEGEAFICAYAYTRINGGDDCKITVTYIDSLTGGRLTTAELVNGRRLCAFFEKCRGTLNVFARPEIDRVTRRLPSLRGIKFPYGKMRDGQRELVKSIYRTVATGTRLFASAPTGTGKTAAVLYPALRALGEGHCEKIFYLTPKSTTSGAPKEFIDLMCRSGAEIRAIVLASKEAACINAHACREGRALCGHSKCARLAEAVLALYELNINVITVKEIRETAREYSVCPHELELSYAELSDVVVCDFNYLFEPTVYIRRFFDEGGDFAFLIDEAHNLPDRAREMYSAEISSAGIMNEELSSLLGEHSALLPAMAKARERFDSLLYPYVKEELRESEEGTHGAQHLSEIPYELYGIFEELRESAEAELRSEFSRKDGEHTQRLMALRSYIRELNRMYSAMISFDRSYEFFIFFDDGNIRCKVFCLDTANSLGGALSKGTSAVFFSATLAPMEYYRATLGGERSSKMLEVTSPFDPLQLSVSVIDRISTRYLQREQTLMAVCRTIAATVSARRGNYMIFSPSFAYSEMLYKAFSAKYPKINVIHQAKDMSYREKQEFLEKFKEKSDTYLIGFCVMGGIYSEGVDLVGDSLIGAVVVGIGIPSVSYEREAMSAYYDERFEAGKQYAYIYPGMNRVFQAAGRVIRREEDRGVIVLIDDRFADPIYKKSASDLFRDMKYIPDAKALRDVLDEFWRGVDEEKGRSSVEVAFNITEGKKKTDSD